MFRTKIKCKIPYFSTEYVRLSEGDGSGSGEEGPVRYRAVLEGMERRGLPSGSKPGAGGTVSHDELGVPGSAGLAVQVRGFWALAFTFCEEGP